MRRPQPWYWASRDAWYVQINKKQIKLSANKDEAYLQYHRLMAGEGLLEEAERRKATVPEVFEAFLYSKQTSRPKTLESYKFLLEPLAKKFKSRRFDSLRVTEISNFVAAQATWADSTKHGCIRAIKTVYRWSREAGYIDHNPLAGFENPYAPGRRNRGMTLEEFEKLLAATRDANFRLVLRILRDVGCRPGELCVLAGRHLHPTLPLATLEPSEHKTGRRTGRPRILIFPADIMEELRLLARNYSTGPLLRNKKGTPWTPGNIQYRFRYYKPKLGLAQEVVPYAARHSAITRLIEGGTDLAMVAKIAGQVRPDVTLSVYYHPDLLKMIAAVQKSAEKVSPDSET